MGTRVDFRRDIYRQLEASEDEPAFQYEFPEWDILKELDRRVKRKSYSYQGSGRLRKWMQEHPEEVERVRKKFLI